MRDYALRMGDVREMTEPDNNLIRGRYSGGDAQEKSNCERSYEFHVCMF